MNGLMIFFFLIVYPFREVLYYKQLINEMFTVCLTQEEFKKSMGIKTKEEQDKEKEDEEAGKD